MKERILSMLMIGEYVSGQKICEELGISRTAVWKHICRLRRDGYDICSETNRGYKLIGDSRVLSKETVQPHLNTQFMGRNLMIYKEVVSTNITAKENCIMPDGTVFLAENQTGGLGRSGHGWKSEEGVGLWFSVLLKPKLAPSEVPIITLIAGFAVCEALGNNFYIKWPNDIVADGKKVCGILTQMSAEIDSIDYIVCGIGINVNNECFAPEIENRATSVFLQTGEKSNRAVILARVLNLFEQLYMEFLNDGFKLLMRRYRDRCITIGRHVSVISKDTVTYGIAEDIAQSGALIVNTGDNKIEVNSGEVSVRGIYGYI